MKETLSSVDAGVFSKIFTGDTFGLDKGRAADEDEDDEMLETETIPVIPTHHSKDAVDYSDFDETVPDDPLFSEKYYRRGIDKLQRTLPRSRLSMVSENYDDEEEESAIQAPALDSIDNTIIKEEPVMENVDKKEKVDIQQLFPGFETGKVLKFSELFTAKIKRPPKLQPHKRSNLLLLLL